jgi:SAM-dependent methyltransferase
VSGFVAPEFNPNRRRKEMSGAVEVGGHYDRQYFTWQKDIGDFGGRAELWKFQPYIKPGDRVVDFGCGGGYILANLACSERIGIEINGTARDNCARLGVSVVANGADIADGWADVVISNHALEHVPDPLDVLVGLRRKMRPGGTIIFVVPCESVATRYRPGNQDRHLFTWSPMNLANLFHTGGYEVLESHPLFHRWMPRPYLVQQLVGWTLFHHGCRIYGTLFKRLSQVRVIARNPI